MKIKYKSFPILSFSILGAIALILTGCNSNFHHSKNDPHTPATTLLGGTIQGNELDLSGEVTTLAGMAGTFGSSDGTGIDAEFYQPYGITTDGTNLYVTDRRNNTIRQIAISTGAVTTLAGDALGAPSYGTTDGTGSAARFAEPTGITTDGTNLYVSDKGSDSIRKVVIATGEVTTLAGGSTGSDDGTGAGAQFNEPYGITTDGTNLYVADSQNNTIRKIVIATGVVTTLAGDASDTWPYGSDDGTGTAALFYEPRGITTDGTNLYVADSMNNTIRKIVIATQEVTTFAGAAGVYDAEDGIGAAASFRRPVGITSDGTNLYVADYENFLIRKIVIATGEVSTLAGTATLTGTTDATGADARFNQPSGVTTDGQSLFVVDRINHTIRKIQ